MDQERYRGLLDMLDGGGMGRSGQKFEGGLFSGLMNALGIRPMGYQARLAEERPMARPAGLGGAAPNGTPAAPPIQTQPLIGGRSPDDILAAINSGRLPPGPPLRPPVAPPAPTALPSFADMLEMDRKRREGYPALLYPSLYR